MSESTIYTLHERIYDRAAYVRELEGFCKTLRYYKNLHN